MYLFPFVNWQAIDQNFKFSIDLKQETKLANNKHTSCCIVTYTAIVVPALSL